MQMTSPATIRQVSAKTIAVATDFSATAGAALDYAVSLAMLHNIKIFLVHALAPSTPPSNGNGGSEAWRELRAQAEAQLQRESAKLADVRHELVLEEGDVLDVLRHVIAANSVDLVVVGSHGQSGKKPLPGSVAERIFRHAGCPVLTIGPNLHDCVPPSTKILFPSDLLDSCAAAAYATTLARQRRARLSFLHVLQGARPPRHRETDWICEVYRDAMRRLVPPGSQLATPPDFLVEFGKDPIGIVLEVARELPADLIVLGVGSGEHPGTPSHDRAGRIVAQATCPVLTIAEARGAQAVSTTK